MFFSAVSKKTDFVQKNQIIFDNLHCQFSKIVMSSSSLFFSDADQKLLHIVINYDIQI